MCELQVNIRDFETDDSIALSRMICDTLQQSNSRDYTEEQIANFLEMYTPEKLCQDAAARSIFVAEMESKIVGTIGLAKHNNRPGCAILLSLFVDPHYQKRGIGRMLVAYVENLALKHPSHTMVVPSSLTAHGFYQKLGYVDEKPNTNPEAINIWMYKKINNDAIDLED